MAQKTGKGLHPRRHQVSKSGDASSDRVTIKSPCAPLANPKKRISLTTANEPPLMLLEHRICDTVMSLVSGFLKAPLAVQYVPLTKTRYCARPGVQ